MKQVQNYKLTAKIGGAEPFDQSVEIETIVKRYSVFIQTDKPVYKPGDIIKFRVLVIDAETKPYQVKNMIVEVLDGNGDVVKPFKDFDEGTFKTGVYVNELVVSTEPVTGNWTLQVVIDDEKDLMTKQIFEVKEYVLPRFEIIADTVSDITQGAGAIKITVSANYTFGEFVIGKATVTARVYDTDYPTKVQQTAVKTVDVEFKRMVEFNIREELKIYNSIRPYRVDFEVAFQENLTGQKLMKTISVRVHKTGEFKIQLVREQKRFKPGYPFKLKAIVRQFDGKLTADRTNPVQFTVNFYYSPPLCTPISEVNNFDKTFEANRNIMLKSGVAEYELKVPANTTAISVTAKYQDAKATLNVTRHVSNSREYLIIKPIEVV